MDGEQPLHRKGMNQMKVSYTKEMRDKALNDRKGLVCIEVQYPSKDGKKFGGRMTYQGPSTREECQQVMEFFNKLAEQRHVDRVLDKLTPNAEENQ